MGCFVSDALAICLRRILYRDIDQSDAPKVGWGFFVSALIQQDKDKVPEQIRILMPACDNFSSTGQRIISHISWWHW